MTLHPRLFLGLIPALLASHLALADAPAPVPLDREPFDGASREQKIALVLSALDARDRDLANFRYALRETCTNINLKSGARRFMGRAEYEMRRLAPTIWMHVVTHKFGDEDNNDDRELGREDRDPLRHPPERRPMGVHRVHRHRRGQRLLSPDVQRTPGRAHPGRGPRRPARGFPTQCFEARRPDHRRARQPRSGHIADKGRGPSRGRPLVVLARPGTRQHAQPPRVSLRARPGLHGLARGCPRSRRSQRRLGPERSAPRHRHVRLSRGASTNTA
jgi:hypothetical protein